MTNEIKLPTIEEIKNNSIDIEPNWFILINHKTTFIHLCAYEEYPTILDIRMLIAELGEDEEFEIEHEVLMESNISILNKEDYLKLVI